MRFKCPKCNSTALGVVVTVFATLYQDADGNIETDTSAGSDHEWDDTSEMQCAACNYRGEAHEFDEESSDEV